MKRAKWVVLREGLRDILTLRRGVMMKRAKWVVLLGAVLVVALVVIAYAQSYNQGAAGQRGMPKPPAPGAMGQPAMGAQPGGMMGGGMMGQAGAACPAPGMMMQPGGMMPPGPMMMSGMMSRAAITVAGKHIYVLAGDRLLKFDSDLNLVRETSIAPDMPRMSRMMSDMNQQFPMQPGVGGMESSPQPMR